MPNPSTKQTSSSTLGEPEAYNIDDRIPDAVITGHRRGRELYSTAPSREAIARARAHLVIAASVIGAISIIFVSVAGFRVFTMALPIGYGPVVAVAIAAILSLSFIAAILLIIYWESRGSLLGWRSDQVKEGVDGVEAESKDLASGAVDNVRAAQLDAAEAAELLDRVDDVKTRTTSATLEGVYAAASVLRVRDFAAPRRSRILALDSKLRNSTEEKVKAVHTDAETLITLADKRVLPALNLAPSAHANEHRTWLGNVAVEELEPEALPYVPVKPESRRVRVLPIVLGALAVLALVAMAIIVGQVVRGAAHPAPPAVPAAVAPSPSASATRSSSQSLSHGLAEGLDYAFTAGPNGEPVHWSCQAPVTVSLVGDAPAQAREVVETAVSTMAAASHLPLQVVRSGTADITVRYVTHDEVVAFAGGGGDGVVGAASPTWNPATGLISSAQILIDDEAEANSPPMASAPWVVVHELGHALGAQHASNVEELMAPTLTDQNEGLGAGDRYAFARLGC
jgi:hypothetical protein